MRTVKSQRKGAIVPLSALFMTGVIAALVFAAELGRMGIIQSELQRAADAGALSASWDLVAQFNKKTPVDDAISVSREAAKAMVEKNAVRGVDPVLDNNAENATSGDIVFGRFTGFGDASATITPMMTTQTNSVTVRVHKDNVRNGMSELILGKLLGVSTFGSQASATAAWIPEVRGFNTPAVNGQTLGILPFSVKTTIWNAYSAGSGTDQWKYDPKTKTVTSGSDGIKELDIYPLVTGSPGNFGTVDVGSSNNSTSDLKRQINSGVSAEDLAYLGGKLELGEDGTLLLNGDTGISASIASELSKIIGHPRIIFLHSTNSGNGNNAYFTEVKFVGIRIVEVKLTGNPKRILIQPAAVVSQSVIAETSGDTSETVYSPVVLVK